MKNTLKLSLKANEKIYVNGAVLRFDRRTNIEFLNDVNFLLEAHVMQLEDAITPMQKLYYIIQVMLISPDQLSMCKAVYSQHLVSHRAVAIDKTTLDHLDAIDQLVSTGRYFDAMKLIRNADRTVMTRRKESEQGSPVETLSISGAAA